MTTGPLLRQSTVRMGRPRGVLDIRPTALDNWSDFGGTMTREGGLGEWRSGSAIHRKRNFGRKHRFGD